MSAFLANATEALLAADPDVLPWVQKYQPSIETVSQTDYEVDLITILTKLSSFAQKINYEAYISAESGSEEARAVRSRITRYKFQIMPNVAQILPRGKAESLLSWRKSAANGF
ncbi:hypothetical protein SAY86_013322 [Trapa natans]|uniref:Uncharacterized protein n=1 Tax=Trapa natans TaxID=22666 RepID=A0AAN7LTI2_TRANT|nr:hypothetical protein SAY86_013322 [Trapa natans]